MSNVTIFVFITIIVFGINDCGGRGEKGYGGNGDLVCQEQKEGQWG